MREQAASGSEEEDDDEGSYNQDCELLGGIIG